MHIPICMNKAFKHLRISYPEHSVIDVYENSLCMSETYLIPFV
jgi:hypothetical protein